MQTRAYRRTFAGGEISPELFGNFDLSKNKTGLKKALNFLISPQGVAQNRPGFQFIQRVKDSSKATRIIPFNYNDEQTYIVELGDQYIRFHTQDSTLLDATSLSITAISNADPGVVTYTGTDPSNGDWLYLASVGGMTEVTNRWVIVSNVDTGANTFEMHDLFGNDIDTSGYGSYTTGGTATPPLEISSPYLEAELFDIHFVQSADVVTLVHPNHAPRELNRVSATSWTLTMITFAPTIAAPTGVTATATVGSGGISHEYVVTSIAEDGLEESLASSSDSVSNDLTTSGNYNTVSWTGASGAVRYNIFKLKNGIYGFIGQAAGTSFIDDNITPDISVTPPENLTPFNATDKYPRAVSYGEQRRIFAGTNTNRQTTWMTRSGTESNLSYSIPTQNDDSIIFRIASRENNVIQHYIPLGDLLAITSSAIWRISAADSGALTPATITAKPQAYVGASNVQPVVTPASILYLESKGAHLYEIVFANQENNFASGYRVSDVAIMAPHLMPKASVSVDLAYQHSPHRTAWMVRGDGQLLGVTYVPEQEMIAWHQHDTAASGLFESVAVTQATDSDELFAVVKRTINGGTVRYIEKLHTREFSAPEDAFFVDSGLTYDGGAVTSVRGLYHLEGETVKVLADGAVHPPVVVTDGVITLEESVSVVQAGLGITADLEIIPLSADMPAFGQGRPMNINEAWLGVYNTSGLWVGPTFDDLIEVPLRQYEPYGSPPALRTEELDIKVHANWSHDATLAVRQLDPLPAALTSLTLEVEIGG